MDCAVPAELVYDVIVIGGGISGLRVAQGATSAGLTVVVLEARGRIGGRLLSRAGVDLGATWCWMGETAVSALADELGIARFAQHEEGDALIDRGAAEAPARIHGGAGARVEGVRFAAGSMALAKLLADRLPPGIVRLGARVATVRNWGGAAGAGAEVTAEEGGAARVFAARIAVVLALPPALAATAIDFDPPLPAAVAALAAGTPTWMGSTAKTVVTYAAPFWRAAGLSGTAFTGAAGGGPLSEIYDHCGADDAGPFALFGFSHGAPAAPAVIAQMVRLFGEKARSPLAVETADWSSELFTSGVRRTSNSSSLRHRYGDPMYARAVVSNGRGGAILLWSSTETSEVAAGHIEGALRAADRCVGLIVRAGTKAAAVPR